MTRRTARHHKMAARFGDRIDWANQYPYAGAPFLSPHGQLAFKLKYRRARRNIARDFTAATNTIKSMSVTVGQVSLIMRRLTDQLRSERGAA